MTGKEVFTEILIQAKTAGYSRYHSLSTAVAVGGEMVTVEFHRIGHNASHDFHIGLHDGLLITMSECEGEEIGETERHFITRGTTEKCEPPTYVGHY